MPNDNALLKNFYVVSVISNPVRFTSRYDLYKKFSQHMEESRVKMITVELQLGDRTFQITEEGNPRHVQLRAWTEIWHKENMINIGISRLPQDWEYVAWIDADVHFVRKNWALETVQQLQHYMFVQMFQNAIDMGPNLETVGMHTGFIYAYLQGLGAGSATKNYHDIGHPGYAWAARREALEYTYGLFDKGILGAGDRHMAMAMIGQAQQSFPAQIQSQYAKSIMRWQARCAEKIKKDVGYVPGTIIHDWHGKKKDRGYQDRWKILVNNGYDPDLDLARNWQLAYELTERNVKLRDDIRRYFRSRNEDSSDLY